ncbi:MAG: hypothetical protein ABIZ49_13905 [Opitutaceae bacterium]
MKNESSGERTARRLGRVTQACVLAALLAAAIARVLLHIGDQIAFRYQGF